MMTLFEGLYNLLILVVFVAVALWLLYVAAMCDPNAPIEPKKIVAWWKSRTNSVPPRVTPGLPRWHPQGFDDYPHSP